MLITLSLVVSLSVGQKIEVIRGGTKKKKAVATAPATAGQTDKEKELAEKERQLAEKQRELDQREGAVTVKEAVVDEKTKELEEKKEEDKKQKEQSKKTAAQQQKAVERMADDNAATVNDLTRALNGQ